MSVVKTIAAALLDLINAQPRSPRVDEIEAVVSKHVPAQSTDPTPKTLTYWEFEAIIKARGKVFAPETREPRSADTLVIWSDPIAVFCDRNARRDTRGLLRHGIYVVRFSEEMDCYMMHASESGAIEGLMPGRMTSVWEARNKALGF